MHKYENWSKEIKNLYDDFPIFTLEEILKNNEQISAEIASKIKPFEFFDDYLSFGYYPYFLEGKNDYLNRLNETLNIILEVELHFLRGVEIANTGNRRETFVLNQLLHSHKVDFSEESDFFVDSKYTFEVGGKNKKRKQIQEIPDSYIIADDIEFGTDRRIPIWLLGFMYRFFLLY